MRARARALAGRCALTSKTPDMMDGRAPLVARAPCGSGASPPPAVPRALAAASPPFCRLPPPPLRLSPPPLPRGRGACAAPPYARAFTPAAALPRFRRAEMRAARPHPNCGKSFRCATRAAVGAAGRGARSRSCAGRARFPSIHGEREGARSRRPTPACRPLVRAISRMACRPPRNDAARGDSAVGRRSTARVAKDAAGRGGGRGRLPARLLGGPGWAAAVCLAAANQGPFCVFVCLLASPHLAPATPLARETPPW